MSEKFKAQIEQIVYSNEENGYTVARAVVPGSKDIVTVVGNLLSLKPGETLAMQGEWTTHPRFGRQFKIASYETIIPATLHGIEKYLGSGLISGIGPVMAKRIVDAFGTDTLDIIENNVDRLAEIEGIGQARVEMIGQAWESQKEVRDVMLFLQAHDVSTGYATKIYKKYGKASIQVVKENPYKLAEDIFGIGFVIADRIAEKIGIDKQSARRIEAGLLYVMQQVSDEGHVFYPYEPLVEKCREVLGVERDHVVQAISRANLAKQIVVEDINESAEEFIENNKAVYLARFHYCETGIAHHMHMLVSAPAHIKSRPADKAIPWVQKQLGITLAEKQVEAVRRAIEEKVFVLTGGPGTGKTTIINAILQVFADKRNRVLLAAPTGRAAKRMSETTGHEAMTIHRMLKYNVRSGDFEKNEQNPLACDLLIIDEVSMVDTLLMYHLLRAVPRETTLVLVGDANQLPSVGAGSVLQDIIASGAVPVVELDEIFRQARTSKIIVNAHMINSGLVPELENSRDDLEDFYFIDREDPEAVLRLIVDLVKERIPKRFGLSPIDDIQVITPMHKGTVGTENLNRSLQEALNPDRASLTRGSQRLCVYDKVMQVRNNYDREVFNGDIGRIAAIDSESRKVTVSFDARHVVYEYADLDELALAYAVSVHKSQGSEFPAVIMPVLTQHYMLLQRNLIYTGITRGRKLVILVGTRKALTIGVKNDKTRRRYAFLRQRLQDILNR